MTSAAFDDGTPRFSMLLPAAWETLDFDPTTRDESIDEIVRRAVGEADSLVAVRQWASDAYRQVYRHGASTGIFFAATFASELAGQMLSASVVAFVSELPVDQQGETMTPTALATALARPGPGEERPVEPPEVVELGIGTSVRTRARSGTHEPDAGGQDRESEMVRFFTPVPEWGLMVVLVFSTPVLAAAGAFAELFDSLAATAHWKY